MLPEELKKRLETRRLILDGAISTMTDRPDGISAEMLCLTDPSQVLDIHRAYLDAGADILTANSFSAKSPATAEAAVRLARRAASLSDSGALVAASLGPIDPASSASEEINSALAGRIKAMLEAGADILLIETATNLETIRAAIRALDSLDSAVPAVMISVSPAPRIGQLLSGETYDQLVALADTFPAVVTLGLNCSDNFDSISRNISILSSLTDRPLSVHPCAGIPPRIKSPRQFAREMSQLLSHHPEIRIAGGCCQTTPAHIALLRACF